jgi:hypothetical protein
MYNLEVRMDRQISDDIWNLLYESLFDKIQGELDILVEDWICE